MTVTAASLKAQYKCLSESTGISDAQITGYIERSYRLVSSSFGDLYDDAVELHTMMSIAKDPYGFDLRPDYDGSGVSPWEASYKAMVRAFGAAFRTLGTG